MFILHVRDTVYLIDFVDQYSAKTCVAYSLTEYPPLTVDYFPVHYNMQILAQAITHNVHILRLALVTHNCRRQSTIAIPQQQYPNPHSTKKSAPCVCRQQ